MAPDLLFALNVLVYASLAAGLIAWRTTRSPNPADALAAFAQLEAALRRAIPDLPDGFTWREAVSEARRRGLVSDWKELDRTLGNYEAYRYGGGPSPGAAQPELLRLLKALRSSS